MGRRLAVPSSRARANGRTLITRGIITRLADRDGVSAPTIERDYVITHVLEAVAHSDPPEGFVFKGGTALRMCFFEDFRYSADLDFSLVGSPESAGIAFVQRALEGCAETIGLPRLALSGAAPRAIDYVGPLGRERRIKLDLVDDELVLETTTRSLVSRYPDQAPEATLATYTLEESAAEKLRCVIQRQLCRDLSDLHRLVVRERVDVETAWSRFETKARAKSIDPRRFAERLSAREPHYRRSWERELSDLEPDARPFDQVVRELRRSLRAHL